MIAEEFTYQKARRALMASFALRVAYTAIGIVLLFVYMLSVLGWDFFRPYWLPVALTIGVGMLWGLLLTLWFMRRVLRYFLPYRHADRPVEPKLLRDLLNIPILFAGLDLFTWMLVGSGLSLYMLSDHPDATARIVVHTLLPNFYVGQLVAIFGFYLFEFMLSHLMWPWVFAQKKISSVQGVVVVPSFVRISVLVITTSIMPMLFIYLLEQVGDGAGYTLFFTLITTVVIAVLQGGGIMVSISYPLGTLSSLFDRLRQGEEVTVSGVYRSDSIGRFAEAFDDLLATLHERDFIRTTFGRYMSKQVVDKILGGDVELGGQRYDATVLFADIRGFTSLSETLQPEQLVEFLNEYLEHMVQAITQHNGIPDKFIGDGILAVWGVPEASDNHAVEAVQAALEMLEKLEQLNIGRSQPIRIGIGLHSGALVAGNIGSKHKMEFTVIGDTVNTCSRIEGLNKELGTTLAISEQVYQQLSTEQQGRFCAGKDVALRGKVDAVKVYTLG